MRKVRLFLPTCFRNVFGMGVSLTTSLVHDIFRKSFPISSQQFRLFLWTFLERQTLGLWLHARCNENNHDWCMGICQFMCYCTDFIKEYIWFQFDISGICTQVTSINIPSTSCRVTVYVTTKLWHYWWAYNIAHRTHIHPVSDIYIRNGLLWLIYPKFSDILMSIHGVYGKSRSALNRGQSPEW